MKIGTTIDNQVFSAQLPLTETFQRSGDHEFFCRLDRGINVRGLKGTSDIHSGGIYYFDAWKALSFVYRDMNISPYRVVWLGDFKEDVRPVLETAKNKISVKMEVLP